MALPDWLEPMAATLTQDRFATPDWIFERKFDGIRVIAFKRGADVRLYSRNRLPWHLPTVADAIAALPIADAILDGEVTHDPSTRADDSARSGRGPVVYHVFDAMWLDGRDVTALPLEDRRALLAGLDLRPPLEHVSLLEHEQPWELARAEGWEGVIAKRKGTPYEHKRSKHWLKMKCELEQDFVVGGFTDPQGQRVGLGALLVGFYENDDLVFAGKIGTGFDTRLLLELRARLNALEIPERPFTKFVGLPRLRAHWVHPEIVVQVGFIEWTTNRKLRHPRLLSVRNVRRSAEREGG
jgi:bifunctional non-homologous end joining protein LigD